MRHIVLSVFCLIFAVAVSSQTVTTPISLNKTAHITLARDKEMDLAINLPAGQYYLVCDLKQKENVIGNLVGSLEWLKSDGSSIDADFYQFERSASIERVGRQFSVAKNTPSRFRLRNKEASFQAWITFVPVKKMRFLPFAFIKSAPGMLGIGPKKVKGGPLEKISWRYHTVTLPAGSWTIALFMMTSDGRSEHLIGSLEFFDKYGFPIADMSKLALNKINQQGQVEKNITVLKPTTLYLRVTNGGEAVKYRIIINKKK